MNDAPGRWLDAVVKIDQRGFHVGQSRQDCRVVHMFAPGFDHHRQRQKNDILALLRLEALEIRLWLAGEDLWWGCGNVKTHARS